MANSFAINTNIQAQQAFQNLQGTNDELSQLRQRLTTGLRVNEASDDAAGFQIANQLEAKTGAQGQALRNIGDAKSALSTAEGALDSQLSILQSAKEKATQAANGSLSQDERNAIANELNQLGEEINDIQENSTFNGDQLLSGDGSGNAKTFKFQTGASSEGSKGQFNVDLKSSSTTDLGVGGNLDLNTGTGKKKAATVDQGDFTNSTGAGNIESRVSSSPVSGTSTIEVSTITTGGDLGGDLEGGKFDITVEDADTGDNELEFTVDSGNDNAVTSTQSVKVSGGSADGNTITLEDDGSETVKVDVGTAFEKGEVGGSETKEFSVEVTDGQLGDRLKNETGNSDNDTGPSEARSIISSVDGAIDTVTEELANLGAAQNRLSFKEGNLKTSKTNLSAAQSRIEDADFAQTQTQVARLQVQQQSGTAALAQANAAGQSVLSLLGG